MSERELSRAEKITAILDMLGIDEKHYDHLKGNFEQLSDHAINRQHAHCLVTKAFIDQEEETSNDA